MVTLLSYDECAERAGISIRTLMRALADGRGPPVVAITGRRRGVIEEDFDAWILALRGPVFARRQ
jgi:predicted DNA-binding transcriptional regulator AlpA